MQIPEQVHGGPVENMRTRKAYSDRSFDNLFFAAMSMKVLTFNPQDGGTGSMIPYPSRTFVNHMESGSFTTQGTLIVEDASGKKIQGPGEMRISPDPDGEGSICFLEINPQLGGSN